MKKTYLRFPCLIASLYFGANFQAQVKQDSALKEEKIQEVVIVGYGKQKKVDLTSSVVSVKAEEIQKTPAGQVAQSIQGKVAGVQISSFGAPGDSPRINIRGINSLSGDNQPLFVVDGIFVDNIDFLSSNDIQDFTVLKDASAAAIYGVKAANGVVVITTKGGNYNRKPSVVYNTYYGFQRASNVVKMANAEQYTNFVLESGSNAERIADAIQRYGRSRQNPNLPAVNTDWYKEGLRTAAILNHSLSIDGGSKDVSYSIGGDFFSQDGILKMKNSFERYNIRAKVDVKARPWLTTGASFIYSNSTKYAPEGSAWQLIYNAVPILPVYEENLNGAYPHRYANARNIGYRSSQNPFALMDNSDLLGIRKRTTASVYADFSIIPRELTFKTTLSYNNKDDNERLMYLPYFADNLLQRTIPQSSIERKNYVNENYILDNVLTYSKKMNHHDITLMGGISYRDDYYKMFSGKGYFVDNGTFSRGIEQTWYLQNTDKDTREASDDGGRFYGISYFGRVSYKLMNRYIAYATFRQEGSNKYAQKYVNLPAVGLAWVVSEENFLKSSSTINLLKLRAGWGRLANDAIAINRPSRLITNQTVFNDQLFSGGLATTYQDNLGWEFTEETNAGLSLELFNRKLSIEADYFVKDTKNLAIDVLPIIGNEESISRRNVGSARNKGFEVAATWKGNINEDFRYTISGNFSRIDNSITSLAGQPYINRGQAEFRQRLTVGQPIDVFYGYVMDGIYQNQAEIDADPVAVAANQVAAGAVQPGFIKFRDLNGDGVLDANDLTYIGSPIPKFYYGGSVSLSYKNVDLAVSFYGQGGNVILNKNRGQVLWTNGNNIDADLAVNRWHGEGTTNENPSAAGYNNPWNQKFSKFFLEKGDFFRIQNIQLGYNLKVTGLPEMRFSITADRPYMWSKSKLLFNPEVGNNGVADNVYPIPSVFTFGYQIKF